MKMVNNKIIKCLAALLIGAAGTAFAGTSCGTNMEYEIVGTELRLTSPDPTSPATINSQAFINRTDFTEISMPDNVTVINTKAFEGCTALTSVVIPPSVTEIGVEAFKGCTNLHNVLCRPQTPPALLGTDGFTNCHESLQICVSALGLYKAATNWSNYTDKLCLCYLDENDERETVAAKLKSFRDAAKNDIDIFRTLRKAGCFNTLTLPFNVPEIAASPLSGAEVYTFTSATVEDGTLQLDITPVLSNGLTAGTPYLIQWDNTGEVLTLMHFTDITWDEDNYRYAGLGIEDNDGNYSNVVTLDGEKRLVSLQLGQIEDLIGDQLGDHGGNFLRLGRSLIINVDYIYLIDIAKQQLILSDCAGSKHGLTASREVLIKLKAYMEAIINTNND